MAPRSPWSHQLCPRRRVIFSATHQEGRWGTPCEGRYGVVPVSLREGRQRPVWHIGQLRSVLYVCVCFKMSPRSLGADLFSATQRADTCRLQPAARGDHAACRDMGGSWEGQVPWLVVSPRSPSPVSHSTLASLKRWTLGSEHRELIEC